MTAARLCLPALALLAGACAKSATSQPADMARPGDGSNASRDFLGGGDDLTQSGGGDDLTLPPPPDYAGLDTKGLDLTLVLPDQSAPSPDLTVTGVADLTAAPPDLTVVNGCQPDPRTDGQMTCASCPNGTIGVNDYQSTLCHCWTACDPAATASTCVCGRRCVPLASADGAANGKGACLPANGAAERCGVDNITGNLHGNGFCVDGTYCVGLDATHGYCMYDCTASATSCPRGTQCIPLTSGPSACIINSQSPGGKAQGMPCTFTNLCAIGSACDGVTCKQECDGPSDTTTCATLACTAVRDAATNNKISSYVCK